MAMKRLLLATSVLALGLGSAAFAQSSGNSPASGNPSYAAPSNSSDQGSTNMNGGGANGGPMASNVAPRSSAMSKSSASADNVKEAQEALQSQGLYKGQVDGKFGPATRHAVAAFQKEKGLKQTAQLDSRTMNDLQSGAGSGSDTMNRVPNDPQAGSGAMNSVPGKSSGMGTPGNGPASSSDNPGGMNGADTTPGH